MKTEVIMYRPFIGSNVRQLHKCGYLCATDITEIYNQIRITEGKAYKEPSDYFKNQSTIEFMQELCNELNLNEKSKAGNSPVCFKPSDLKKVFRGKNNKGTWLHPYLFTDYAMWLSPKFRAKVVIWVSDNLLFLRDSGGDAFKRVNRKLDMKFDIGSKYWEYAKVAKLTAMRVLGNETPDQWNFANREQLHERDCFLYKLEYAAEYGNFQSVDELIKAV